MLKSMSEFRKLFFSKVLFLAFNILVIASGNEELLSNKRPTIARLVTPNGETGHPFGRVEVYHNGQWGTICSDYWTNENARVICRMIGYHSKHALAISHGLLGEGDGEVLLSRVRCKGDETNLDKCQHTPWNGNSCDHAQDAGVICTEQIFEETNPLAKYHDKMDCSNRGSLECKCQSGFTGPNCESEVDYCAELVTAFQDGPIPAGQLCQPHGYCISTDTGAVCVCEYGYNGEFCHDVIDTELYQSVRCALYSTPDVIADNITVGCPDNQNCIPDRIHCVVTDKCEKPFGWCLPYEEYDKYMNDVNKKLKLQ